ncbi:hypothetical protein GF345_01205 [Candidatus Woesearchaeota archaeon]|nr:hypothetical protein [Candidatus Woesearchaeota archaeon]
MAMLKHFKAAPLSSGFFLVSILGILVTLFYWNTIWDQSWSFALLVLFICMFIASMISTAKAPIEAEIAVDHHAKKSSKTKKK